MHEANQFPYQHPVLQQLKKSEMPFMVFLYSYYTWMILKFPDNISYWFVTYIIIRWKFALIPIFSKKSLRVWLKCFSLFFETSLSSSVREKRFYIFPKLFIIRNISYIEVIKIIYLCFSNHCNTKASLFVVSLFTFLRFWLQKFIA